MGRKKTEHMRILLAGNPNCGKSTLFNALTGGHAKTGNWHGVTVGMTERAARIGGHGAVFADLPGIYSLSSPNMEEEISRRALAGKDYAAALVVMDALTLPRSLHLFYEVKALAPKTLLVVTMRDLLRRRGGFLDEKKLSEMLGVPVICVNAHSGRDIKKLRLFLSERLFAGEARGGAPNAEGAENARGDTVPVSEELACAWSGGAFKESRAEKLLYNPFVAVPLFFVTLLAVFFLAFADKMPGVLLKNLLEGWVSDDIGGFLSAKARGIGAAPAAVGLISALFSGLGMLLSFLPQIAILYLALFIMEESGYMSALAFMTDGIFRKAGLTGRAAFSVLMGFGCSAAAILTTRGLENKDVQRRAILILPYISCSAKMPVYLAVISCFFAHKFLALALIYFGGVALAFAAAFILKAVRPAEEELVMEIAHLQFPSVRQVAKSLLFSCKQFIIKIVTTVTAVLIAMWFLLSFDFSMRYVGEGGAGCMAEVLCRGLKYLFYPMGITDWQVALSALTGLVAKESVAGMLAVFYGADLSAAMSAASAAAFTAFIMACSPCVSAIAAAARELGIRRALLNALLQTGIAFLLAYAVYAALYFGAALAAVLAAGVCLALFAGRKRKGKKREKNHLRRENDAQRSRR